MEYRLLRADDERSTVAASADLDGELAAMTWARSWLENHADRDHYRLEPAALGRPILMVRTVAGQWYAIPVAEEESELAR